MRRRLISARWPISARWTVCDTGWRTEMGSKAEPPAPARASGPVLLGATFAQRMWFEQTGRTGPGGGSW